MIVIRGPQSGMSHAITVNESIRCKTTSFHGSSSIFLFWNTVDCIKMGIYLLNGRRPDIIYLELIMVQIMLIFYIQDNGSSC